MIRETIRNAPVQRQDVQITVLTVNVAKEIQLQHRAAVMSIAVIDRAMQLLGSALGGQLTGAKNLDMTGGHQVVICSEQQVKVSIIPALVAVILC